MTKAMKTGPGKVILLAALLGATMTALPAIGSHEHTGQVSPPRPAVTIEPVGEVSGGGAYAVLKVTITCPADEDVYLNGSLRQDNVVGRTDSSRNRYFACDGEPATEEIIFNTGYSSVYAPSRIRPGKAFVELNVALCMNDEVYLGCRRVSKERIVQLELAGLPLNLPL